MAKSRRKVAYKTNKMNRFPMFLVTVVLLMLIAVVSIKKVELKQTQQQYAVREAALQAQIDQEKARTTEIEEYAKYTQTKKYVEEVARDKLGLVYDDEIIFKTENAK